MLFEKIKSPGLAHYSYIIGDQNEACVIDPKRDVDIYIKKATQAGYNIKYIFETHRNEDYIIGSKNLAKLTKAEIYHGDDNLNYQYGKPIKKNQIFNIGRLKIKAIHTPGHTLYSYSYLLNDFSDQPLMIFTGDVLFAGDTGRIDLMGEDKMDLLASKLYNSIFNKILPLGDEVILCPAHGAGSVCGDTIAEREFTTLGLEKKVNPKLQYTKKDEFIKNVKKVHERPPYFRKMEKLNLTGADSVTNLMKPEALDPREFKKRAENDNFIVLDTRNELSFSAAHIPNSISIWQEGLASFAGWFLPYDKDILIVSPDQYPQKELDILYRQGFDNIKGYLEGGLLKWHMAGLKSFKIGMSRVNELCSLLDNTDNYWLLDIRSKNEIKNQGKIKNAHNIHLTQLPDNLHQIPKDLPIYIFCGSGLRSTTSASLLKKEGFENINVILGGLKGWSSTTCPIIK